MNCPKWWVKTWFANLCTSGNHLFLIISLLCGVLLDSCWIYFDKSQDILMFVWRSLVFFCVFLGCECRLWTQVFWGNVLAYLFFLYLFFFFFLRLRGFYVIFCNWVHGRCTCKFGVYSWGPCSNTLHLCLGVFFFDWLFFVRFFLFFFVCTMVSRVNAGNA